MYVCMYVLNVSRSSHDTCLYINENALPVVESTYDLGILVSCDSSLSLHVSDIVVKAHKRAAAIHRTFVSRNIHWLVHSLYMSGHSWSMIVLWSPFTVRDIEAVESVQRRFTMRLPGFNSLSYLDHLKRVNLHSLKPRRLYTDLFHCYKMLFWLVDIQVTDFFEWTPCHNTRGHNFKLYKKSYTMRVRSTFLMSVSSMSGMM